jgi:hypothetical protein
MTVYVLQCQQTSNIKIGFTARQIESRLRELKTAASTPITLVKQYESLVRCHEQQLHAMFGHLRVTGEWFKPETLDLIDEAVIKLGASAMSLRTKQVMITELTIKKSTIIQLDQVSMKSLFCFDEDKTKYYFRENVVPWGWIRFKESEFLLAESNGNLVKYLFNYLLNGKSGHESCKAALFLQEIKQKGSVHYFSNQELWLYCTLDGRTTNISEEEYPAFSSYIRLIKPLPQLFLA